MARKDLVGRLAGTVEDVDATGFGPFLGAATELRPRDIPEMLCYNILQHMELQWARNRKFYVCCIFSEPR